MGARMKASYGHGFRAGFHMAGRPVRKRIGKQPSRHPGLTRRCSPIRRHVPPRRYNRLSYVGGLGRIRDASARGEFVLLQGTYANCRCCEPRRYLSNATASGAPRIRSSLDQAPCERRQQGICSSSSRKACHGEFLPEAAHPLCL